MSILYIILFSFLEIVALIVIVRMWMHRRVRVGAAFAFGRSAT
jgi:hypothetical protein